MTRDQQKWRKRDRKVLWHPFTQHGLWEREDFPVIERGEGVFLYDVEGREYLDGVSSLWVNIHGHRRPELDQALRDQLDKIAHSTFLGLSHPPGIMLAERLLEIAPEGLSRVFFSDNGSTAVEIALKMAYQYWRQKSPPEPEREFFISFVNAYHGDTIGSVSVGGIDLFHATYRSLLFPALKTPAPYCFRCHLPSRKTKRGKNAGPEEGHLEKETRESDAPRFKEDCEAGSGCLAALERLLRENEGKVAGVVLEPVVQGAAGMLTQPKGFVKGVRELCDRYRTLLIADEVATGFGRTGKMFALEWEGVSPDLMALGKGITGGYLPLAATLATEEIFSAFLGPYHSTNTFFHGHSYTANPLGCAVALKSLELFEKDRLLENVEKRGEQIEEWRPRFLSLSHVGDFRRRGMMVGIELVAAPETNEPYEPSAMMGREVCLKARENGLNIRPLGDVVVLMPPLCIDRKNLERILEITFESIKEVTGE